MIKLEQDLSTWNASQIQELLSEAAKDAIFMQDACNLSGVVYAWAGAMDLICELAHRNGHGTDWKNKHPVNVLFASKVASLTSEVLHFPHAYDECKKLASA